MSIIRVAERPRYTRISNHVFSDHRLSFKAVGVLCQLLSYPDNWKVNAKHLSTTHTDGQTAVRSALKELKECGYLRKYPVKDELGRISYWESVIFEFPLEEETQNVENPHCGESSCGKPERLINTYSNQELIEQELSVCSEEDEQPTHTPAEPKDLNSDQGKEENEALERISSEEPESKVKNSHNPDKLENPKKESSAKERKVSAAAENSTSPPGYAPKTAVGTFPDESAILNAWNGLKAQKWRAMAAGTIVGSSILGIQFFLNHANGDPSGAVTLFKKTLEVAANDDYFKKMSLRPNQALDPNSSAFIGHFLGDALQAEKPAPVSPAPAPAHTTEPIQPTFFFGGL